MDGVAAIPYRTQAEKDLHGVAVVGRPKAPAARMRSASEERPPNPVPADEEAGRPVRSARRRDECHRRDGDVILPARAKYVPAFRQTSAMDRDNDDHQERDRGSEDDERWLDPRTTGSMGSALASAEGLEAQAAESGDPSQVDGRYGRCEMTMRQAAAAKADAVDDAFIIAVGRAAQANGLVVQFDENVVDGDEVIVGVSIRAALRVRPDETVASGRRRALATLVE